MTSSNNASERPRRRHNSFVLFAFNPELSSTNSYKLSRLNVIFEKAADRRLGGIRTEKIVRILPSNAVSKEKYICILNDLGVLDEDSQRSSHINEYTSAAKRTDAQVISRGPFLAMFANEKTSFLNMLAVNEKAEREKKQRRIAQKRHQNGSQYTKKSSVEDEFRGRANSAPSKSASPEDKKALQDSYERINDDIREPESREVRKNQRIKNKKKSRSRRRTGNENDQRNPQHVKEKRRIRVGSSYVDSSNTKEPTAQRSKFSKQPRPSTQVSDSEPLSDINMNGQSGKSTSSQHSHTQKKSNSSSSNSMGKGKKSESSFIGMSYSYSSSSESEIIEIKKRRKKKKQRGRMNAPRTPMEAEQSIQYRIEMLRKSKKEISIQRLSQSKVDVTRIHESIDGGHGECVFLEQVTQFLKQLFPARRSAVVGVAPHQKQSQFNHIVKNKQ